MNTLIIMVKLFFVEMKNAKSCSELYVRKILGEHLGADGDKLTICKNKFGKPYLKEHPDIYYNVSHTIGALVCVISDRPVGIDIERVKKINKRITEYFFTENEQNYIYAHKENQDERFIEIWTKKEAYVKYMGKGLNIPFKSFDVLSKDGIFLLTYDNYRIALCTKGRM